MKKIVAVYIFFILFLFFTLQCTPPSGSHNGGDGDNMGTPSTLNYLWSKRIGGLNDDFGNGITVDSNNNLIITGIIAGDADLNGDGDYLDNGESYSGYGDRDIFITKYDSNNTYLWSKRFGGVDTDGGSSVITDSNNDIIITGHIEGEADLNGDGDRTDTGESFIGFGYEDIIIIKINSEGTYQWSKRLGGITNDYGYKIVSDSNNNIYITARIYGDVDLNGDGDNTDGGAESGTGYAFQDVALVKFNSSGIYQWAKRIGGVNNENGIGIKTDSNNNVIITGWAAGDADLNGDGDYLDPGEVATGYDNTDIFIVKFNSSGTYLWSKRLGGLNYDYGNGIAVDSDDNLIITGSIRENVDLNGDGDYLDNGEPYSGYDKDDIFIVKFNSSGTYLWSKRLGGLNYDNGNYLISDSNNNIYITGYIEGNADLNGDGDSNDGNGESGTGYGDKDAFIIKFNSDGISQGYKRLGGTNADMGNEIALDSNNHIVIIGKIYGNVDLNGDGDSNDGNGESGTGYAGSDIFIAGYSN